MRARPAPYLAILAWVLAASGAVHGQVVDDADLTDRPITEISLDGLDRVEEQLVRNQLRSTIGSPYVPDTVKGDLTRLNRLGQFSAVTAEAELLPDGTVRLIYQFVEAPIIAEVQVVGNKAIADQELLTATNIDRGMPRNDFLIENAQRAIVEKYRERGYYLTTVTVDETQLEESGILFFRVIEGPRVKVKAIEFRGNHAYSDDQLHAEISTRTAVPLFRRGELDEEKLLEDVDTLESFYRDRGYLDARVDRTLELSPDSTEVKVTFLIVEGRRFTLRRIRTDPDPLAVFSREQIEAMIDIKPGDVYSNRKINDALAAIRNAYGLMGYTDPLLEPNAVRAVHLRSSEEPEVDLLLIIREGSQYKVGKIEITGNFLTRDRVIRRHLRGLQPGRPFDARQIARSENEIRQTRLFGEVHITALDPDPARPDYRDVLVEVKEANTGSVNFGVAAGSDTGLFGEFSVVQRNFDITDLPQSAGELFSGRAFRGGGQRFSMTLRPGNEIFQYVVSWFEPSFADSPYSLGLTGQYRAREINSRGSRLYDEERLSFPITVGRRMGEFWDFAISTRFERVTLSDIVSTAPVDVFEAQGPDNFGAVSLRFTRSTVTTFNRPGEGTRFEGNIEQVFGDFDFTKVTGDYTVFITVYRDFVGRRQILKLTGRMGYIFGGDAPLYERFYLGGRTFRGFEFRTVSPKGLDSMGNQTGDSVGGNWLVFFGAQYEIPLIQESITGVFFVDSGTVTDDPGFADYRVSVGAGLRIYLPQFGPVPIALDFGFPLKSDPLDEEEVFSFSAEVPF